MISLIKQPRVTQWLFYFDFKVFSSILYYLKIKGKTTKESA